MTIQIHSKPSKSGKRTMFYPTINGNRITATLFGKKWEAQSLAERYLKAVNQ